MKRVLAVFFTIMFMIGTDTFLISPLLPTLQQVYHISTELSGWMVSSYALGYAVFALIAGPISDGLNRKKVMVIGMSFFALSTFFMWDCVIKSLQIKKEPKNKNPYRDRGLIYRHIVPWKRIY